MLRAVTCHFSLKKTSVKLASQSFCLPSIEVNFSFTNDFFQGEEELIKQREKKKRCWQDLLHICKSQHCEQSQTRVTSLSTDIYSPALLHPPPLHTCPIWGPSRRVSEHHSTQLDGTSRGDWVHLLLPSTEVQTSPFSSLKQREKWCRSYEAMPLAQFKAKAGGWGAEVETRNQ